MCPRQPCQSCTLSRYNLILPPCLCLAFLAASSAEWVRRPPRERKIRGSITACAVGIFAGSSHTSNQICSWNTLVCCWDVKQATNQPTNKQSKVLVCILYSALCSSMFVSPCLCSTESSKRRPPSFPFASPPPPPSHPPKKWGHRRKRRKV